MKLPKFNSLSIRGLVHISALSLLLIPLSRPSYAAEKVDKTVDCYVIFSEDRAHRDVCHKSGKSWPGGGQVYWSFHSSPKMKLKETWSVRPSHTIGFVGNDSAAVENVTYHMRDRKTLKRIFDHKLPHLQCIQGEDEIDFSICIDPLSHNLLWETPPKSLSCRLAILKMVGEIEQNRDVQIKLVESSIHNPPSHLGSRKSNYLFALSGKSADSIMTSPVFMQTKAEKLIKRCNLSGIVTFNKYASDYSIPYGLMSDQKVIPFRPIQCEPRDRKCQNSIKWGEYRML